MRRFHRAPSAFGTESLDRKATNIIEDISERKSGESYFIQLADLNAYAAFRKIYPATHFNGKFWNELGNMRIKEVNYLSGGEIGIVDWPK